MIQIAAFCVVGFILGWGWACAILAVLFVVSILIVVQGG